MAHLLGGSATPRGNSAGMGARGSFPRLPLDAGVRSACTTEPRRVRRNLDADRAGYGGKVMKAVAPSRRCIFRLPG
jgi:hypothetical protein